MILNIAEYFHHVFFVNLSITPVFHKHKLVSLVKCPPPAIFRNCELFLSICSTFLNRHTSDILCFGQKKKEPSSPTLSKIKNNPKTSAGVCEVVFLEQMTQ